jgi:T5orf172 domain
MRMSDVRLRLLALPAIGLRELPKIGTVVYFLRAGNGLTKIGHSHTLRGRISAYRGSSPVPVDIIAFGNSSGRAVELAIHHVLDAERAHCEWFHPSERLLRLVDLVKSDDWALLLNRFRNPLHVFERREFEAELGARLGLRDDHVASGGIQ